MKNKYNKYFKGLVALLFVLATLIRLSNFDYPIANQEIHIQYLVSSHISKLWELPLVGYFNGTFPSLGATPIYNYILAILILFYESLTLINFLNLVLQIASIYILYKLAKGLFGEKTAIIALIFMTFSSVLITQSEWMWQPHLMFFFVNLSFYLLYLFYKQKSIKYLALSNLSFALSASIHISSLTLTPIYLICIYIAQKRVNNKIKIPVFSALFLAINTFLLYLPLVFHHQRFDTAVTLSMEEKLVNSIAQFNSNFLTKVGTFQEAVGISAFLGLILTFLFIFFLFFTKQKKEEKVKLSIFLLAVLSPILSASFFNETFLPQHFTAVYGLFFILVSVLITNLLKKHILSRLLVFLLVAFITFNTSGEFKKLEARTPLQNLKTHKNMTSQIAKAVEKVEKDSFQFRLYTSDSVDKAPDDVWFFDTLFWPSLEDEFNRPFTKVSEERHGYWYEVTNSDENLFVGCFGFENTNVCTQRFLEGNENYHIKNNIFENIGGYSFFIAEKR